MRMTSIKGYTHIRIVGGIALALLLVGGVTAQSVSLPFSITTVPVPAASCPTPTAGVDILCDTVELGEAVARNGAAYAAASGTPGPKGDPGLAASISMGTVSTLPAGSAATVQNSGTTSAAVFNFGIPQGIQGAQGQAPASFKCATMAVDSTGVTFSGCK